MISLLELSDVMDKPRLFSTFMLWMLAELYESLPEVGDLPKPKMCFFFDEAHLLFDDISDALMEQIERTARLIRSKGVGVYFATQAPTDVPSSVLAQLGNRVEHALRAFTPEDADALRKTVRTFPTSTFYDVEKLLTSLGIGEAAVTVLSPRGIPTPLAATRLAAPDSSMTPLSDADFVAHVAAGALTIKYGTPIDRDSAYERITSRLQREAAAQAAPPPPPPPPGPYAPPGGYAYPPQPGYPAQPKPMTPAQQQAEIRRQAREMAAQQRAAEREAAAQRREQAAAERRAKTEQARTERERARVVNSVVRGVFGVLTGRRRW